MSLVERSYEFVVDASRDDAFRLLGDPENLNLVTPAWFSFEILRYQPDRMGLGTEIEYWLRWRFLRVKWCSRVTEWEPPERFTYEQARGPFKSFSHEHLFLEDVGGTRVVDRLLYEPPGGRIADRLFVSRDLERIFSFRSAAVRQSLSSPTSAGLQLGRSPSPTEKSIPSAIASSSAIEPPARRLPPERNRIALALRPPTTRGTR